MSREPIKHTCPAIDRYIRHIKSEIVDDGYIKNMGEDELRDAASSMSSTLSDCIDYLEDLRKSNDTLRQWGIDESNRVDELEDKVYELDSRIPID